MLSYLHFGWSSLKLFKEQTTATDSYVFSGPIRVSVNIFNWKCKLYYLLFTHYMLLKTFPFLGYHYSLDVLEAF